MPAGTAGPFTTATTVFGSRTSDEHSWTILWTNLGPLRTIFTPPAGCELVPSGDVSLAIETTTLTSSGHEDFATKIWLTYRTCGHTKHAYISDGCIPAADKASYVIFDWNVQAVPMISSNFYDITAADSYSAHRRFDATYHIATYYSPAWQCPFGWHTVGSFVLPSKEASDTAVTITGSWQKDVIRIGGTHVICCPSGFTQYTDPLIQDQGNRLLAPIGCTSTATTQSVGSFCRDFCRITSSTGFGGSIDTFCEGEKLRTFNPGDTSQALGYEARPVYMIHNKDDLEWRPSNVSTIVPAVVVPVVALAMAILGVLYLLRRRKRNAIWKSRNAPAYGVKTLEDTEYRQDENTNNAELEDTTRFELEQSVRQPPELDIDQEIREAPQPAQTSELQDTGRLELSGSLLAQHEMPTSEHQEHRHIPTWYDNEPFEKYPSAILRPQNTAPSTNDGAESRLATQESENARLDEDIRRLQMTNLMEQKRKIEEEIAALRSN